VIITLIIAFSSVPVFPTAVYTFEDANELLVFSAASSTIIELSTTHYKHGTKSMKWTWASENEITHSISVSKTTNIIDH